MPNIQFLNSHKTYSFTNEIESYDSQTSDGISLFGLKLSS